jgi:hypothetical protein
MRRSGSGDEVEGGPNLEGKEQGGEEGVFVTLTSPLPRTSYGYAIH